MTKKTRASKQNSRVPKLLSAALSLVAAYIFSSLAIDSGSFWHYLLAVIFIILSLKFIIRSLRN